MGSRPAHRLALKAGTQRRSREACCDALARPLSFFVPAIRWFSAELLYHQSRIHASEQEFYVVVAHSLLISRESLGDLLTAHCLHHIRHEERYVGYHFATGQRQHAHNENRNSAEIHCDLSVRDLWFNLFWDSVYCQNRPARDDVSVTPDAHTGAVRPSFRAP